MSPIVEDAVQSPPRSKTADGRVRMTVEEFLALPEDENVHRELIGGVLYEDDMTVRSRRHCRSESLIATRLQNGVWENKGRDCVCSGEAGVVLKPGESAVGADVLVIDRADYDRAEAEQQQYFDCTPLMVVEVLSPSDQHMRVVDKIDKYVEAGTPLVWLADPQHRTITAYRPGQKPVFFEADDPINADPAIPNFSVPTSHLFDT